MNLKDRALALFGGNGKVRRQQEMKARIVRNREGLYQTLNEWTEVAKGCAFILMDKCKGPHCDLFIDVTETNLETKKKFTYSNCVFRQKLLAQFETNQRLFAIENLLGKLVELQTKEIKDKVEV